MVGPHPRHARRAHHVRRQGGAVVPAGRPRPRPAARGPRGGGRRQAVGRGRHLLQHRSRGRAHVCARPRPRRRCRPPRCIARDRHAEYLWACASVGRDDRADRAPRSATCSAPRCGEVEEAFRPGQKGSSAMPHKRNPIKAEQLCGPGPRAARQPAGRARERGPVARARHLPLVGRAGDPARLVPARVLRARADAGASSTGCGVYAERMLDNLDGRYGLVFSQPVLLALVAGGLAATTPTASCRRTPCAAWEERRPFRVAARAGRAGDRSTADGARRGLRASSASLRNARRSTCFEALERASGERER